MVAQSEVASETPGYEPDVILFHYRAVEPRGFEPRTFCLPDRRTTEPCSGPKTTRVLPFELSPRTIFTARSTPYGSPVPRVSQRTISQRLTRTTTSRTLNWREGFEPPFRMFVEHVGIEPTRPRSCKDQALTLSVPHGDPLDGVDHSHYPLRPGRSLARCQARVRTSNPDFRGQCVASYTTRQCVLLTGCRSPQPSLRLTSFDRPPSRSA